MEGSVRVHAGVGTDSEFPHAKEDEYFHVLE
jgi:hypothetical protein